MFLKTLRPVEGTEFVLEGGHRAFLVEHDNRFDEIPWGGLALLFADQHIEADQLQPLLAALLMYRARSSLRGCIDPLEGLKGCYRKGSDHAVASVLLGEDIEAAYANLYSDCAAGPKTDRRDFRRRLGGRLRLDWGHGPRRGSPGPGGPLPPGIVAKFKLPKWDSTHGQEVRRIHEALGAHITRWRRPGGHGRRPSDPLRWMKDRFSHCTDPPLLASREGLVCSVAYATWIAQAICYPYAMATLAGGITPPLNRTEQLLFRWYHGKNALLGIPLQCVRPDWWDLVRPVAMDLVRGRIGARAAQRQMARALGLHTLLVDEDHDEDQQRKRETKEREALPEFRQVQQRLAEISEEDGSDLEE